MSESGVSSLIHQTLLGDAWENATAAISVFSDDGRYIACNRAFCELSGYTREEIMQMRVGVDLAADDRNLQLFKGIVGEGRRRGTGGLKRKDGTVVECDVEAIATTVANLPYHIVLYFGTSTSTS
jgi:PAS domain S-box-containing protein